MPRYAARRVFPDYSYVPGKFPHPTCDPRGHSYGHEPIQSKPLTPENWRRCESYLWGIDLFNHGYYWEAHEAWEAVWISVGRRGSVADLLKALIKLAAAGVKAREGREAGVHRHALRCVELLNGLQTAKLTSFCGLDLGRLKIEAAAVGAEANAVTQLASADTTSHAIPLRMVLSESGKNS